MTTERRGEIPHRVLQDGGHTTTLVATGREGRSQLEDEEFDALVLDLTLPDADGILLAGQLREEGNDIPILMLTAKDTLDDRLRGFAAGADDYLVKPFAMREFMARITVLLRRGSVVRQYAAWCWMTWYWTVDRAWYLARRTRILLALKEFAVLELLLDHAGDVLSRETIICRSGTTPFEGNATVVDTTIKRLRRAIDAGRPHGLIQTVRGTGYRIAGSGRTPVGTGA